MGGYEIKRLQKMLHSASHCLPADMDIKDLANEHKCEHAIMLHSGTRLALKAHLDISDNRASDEAVPHRHLRICGNLSINAQLRVTSRAVMLPAHAYHMGIFLLVHNPCVV